MSGRTSLIIIGALAVVLVVAVYYFSTPNPPTHLMPVGVADSSTIRSIEAARGAEH